MKRLQLAIEPAEKGPNPTPVLYTGSYEEEGRVKAVAHKNLTLDCLSKIDVDLVLLRSTPNLTLSYNP